MVWKEVMFLKWKFLRLWGRGFYLDFEVRCSGNRSSNLGLCRLIWSGILLRIISVSMKAIGRIPTEQWPKKCKVVCETKISAISNFLILSPLCSATMTNLGEILHHWWTWCLPKDKTWSPWKRQSASPSHMVSMTTYVKAWKMRKRHEKISVRKVWRPFRPRSSCRRRLKILSNRPGRVARVGQGPAVHRRWVLPTLLPKFCCQPY